MTACTQEQEFTFNESNIDPIQDIMDYLVRCANISFKNSHSLEDVSTEENISVALSLYKQSPTHFLQQFGKFLSPHHLNYFENLLQYKHKTDFYECINKLKLYHSNENTQKRIKNRRYKALQKLKDNSDYFSEKQMMYRNPLLYEQLVGQYLTDEELQERDSIDNEHNTFLNVILETVDRNEMREKKNIQSIYEESHIPIATATHSEQTAELGGAKREKRWGDFDEPDTIPSHIPERRKQMMINANERNLLREEFLQEMYSSFIEGNDIDFDYTTVDNNEEYDDLKQISQDAEDKYFDSENNDSENLEEHMNLISHYGQNNCNNIEIDPLDEFMDRIESKLKQY